MRLNSRPKRVGERLDEQCFCRSRQAGDQAVAADEEGDQYLLEHLVLTDDHAPYLGHDIGVSFLESFNPAFQFDSIERWSSGHFCVF